MDLIEGYAEKIRARMDQQSIDPAVKASADATLRTIDADLEAVTRGDGHEDFLLTYLHGEQARFQAETAEDIPEYVDADERRSWPLCGCSNSDCDIKKARLPRAVLRASTMAEGIRAYKQEHPGYPAALDEAEEAWRAKRATVRRTMRRVVAALASGVTVEEFSAGPSNDGETPEAKTAD